MNIRFTINDLLLVLAVSAVLFSSFQEKPTEVIWALVLYCVTVTAAIVLGWFSAIKLWSQLREAFVERTAWPLFERMAWKQILLDAALLTVTFVALMCGIFACRDTGRVIAIVIVMPVSVVFFLVQNSISKNKKRASAS